MLALVLIASGLFSAALADDPGYQDGLRHRDAFDYERALASFERALASDQERTPEERALLLVYIGVLRAELSDPAAAREAFDEALGLDAKASLTLDVSPTIRQIFDDARAARAAAPAQTATTTPEAEPPLAISSATPPAPASADLGGAEEEAGLAPVQMTGLAVASGGALVAVVGALVWSAGAARFLEADAAVFQAETAKLNDEAATLQLLGQGTAVAGALVGGVGVALALLWAE